MNLEQVYSALCSASSDINEHLPTLKRYAEECDHVTEMGVRWVVSTYAFVVAKPKRLISIDIIDPRNLDEGTYHWNNYRCGDRMNQIIDHCAVSNIDYKFIHGDTTKIEIEETDLLFIDTMHTYNQVKTELSLHGNKSRKYLIFHDTVSFRHRNETDPDVYGKSTSDKIGIWPAIDEFLSQNTHWKIHEIFENCNGLTVLKRDN